MLILMPHIHLYKFCIMYPPYSNFTLICCYLLLINAVILSAILVVCKYRPFYSRGISTVLSVVLVCDTCYGLCDTADYQLWRSIALPSRIEEKLYSVRKSNKITSILLRINRNETKPPTPAWYFRFLFVPCALGCIIIWNSLYLAIKEIRLIGFDL